MRKALVAGIVLVVVVAGLAATYSLGFFSSAGSKNAHSFVASNFSLFSPPGAGPKNTPVNYQPLEVDFSYTADSPILSVVVFVGGDVMGPSSCSLSSGQIHNCTIDGWVPCSALAAGSPYSVKLNVAFTDGSIGSYSTNVRPNLNEYVDFCP